VWLRESSGPLPLEGESKCGNDCECFPIFAKVAQRKEEREEQMIRIAVGRLDSEGVGGLCSLPCVLPHHLPWMPAGCHGPSMTWMDHTC